MAVLQHQIEAFGKTSSVSLEDQTGVLKFGLLREGLAFGLKRGDELPITFNEGFERTGTYRTFGTTPNSSLKVG